MAKDAITDRPLPAGTKTESGKERGPEKSITKLDTWRSFAKYGCFDSEAEQQWWNDSGALIARFLQIMDMDIHQQYQYLVFFRQMVIPALGPWPPVRRCCLNTSEIVWEPSVNWGPGNPVLRVSIDPISKITATALDPLNIDTVNSMVSRLASLGLEGFDRTLHYHFTREFCIPEERLKTFQQESREPIAWSQTLLGFDFKDGKIVTKQYLWTRQASHASGLHPHALIRRAVAGVEPQMRCSEAVELVLEYMEKFHASTPVPFFSWDLVDPSKSRLKLYSVDWKWTWAKVQEVCTLGGKLQGPLIDRSLDILAKLWDMLKLDESKPTMGAIWNFEIRPGHAQPSIKFYFALCDLTDAEAAQVVSQWFDLLGWHEKARSYPEILRYLQPNRNLDTTKGSHSWLSVMVTEDSAYTSLYYHPLGNGPDDHKIRESWFSTD
ncbi:uncharacterized protein N7482_001463 [Penicillium canariense]|uniref:Uncharacterized protein n=1 Tax=Penicillium canariense TaxID=189055 RepID=A0A9W9IJS1_9EURO|nr:uncharacterized protein N7482_001463 [Penicillium canariense]KAJ5175586.1 hypothetical protein N7482_001463 [Penicillium canariense]